MILGKNRNIFRNRHESMTAYIIKSIWFFYCEHLSDFVGGAFVGMILAAVIFYNI